MTAEHVAKPTMFSVLQPAGVGPEAGRHVPWDLAPGEGLNVDTRFVAKPLPNGNTIRALTDPDKDPPQTIAVCLDGKVGVDLSKHYDLSADPLLIVRDVALDDTTAANLALQCRLKTI